MVAWITPLCLSVPAKMPTASPCSLPRFSAASVGACTCRLMPSRPRPVSSIWRPAASIVLPFGAWINASLPVSTLLPNSTTSPLRASTLPCTETAAVDAVPSPKRRRAARASASLMRSDDAVKPAVSTTAPAPTVMPDWFTSTRLPLLPSVPNSSDGVLVTTRLIDVLVALGCWKKVVLPAGMEKLCQLIAE